MPPGRSNSLNKIIPSFIFHDFSLRISDPNIRQTHHYYQQVDELIDNVFCVRLFYSISLLKLSLIITLLKSLDIA